jgi:hypothetical protein
MSNGLAQVAYNNDSWIMMNEAKVRWQDRREIGVRRSNMLAEMLQENSGHNLCFIGLLLHWPFPTK